MWKSIYIYHENICRVYTVSKRTVYGCLNWDSFKRFKLSQVLFLSFMHFPIEDFCFLRGRGAKLYWVVKKDALVINEFWMCFRKMKMPDVGESRSKNCHCWTFLWLELVFGENVSIPFRCGSHNVLISVTVLFFLFFFSGGVADGAERLRVRVYWAMFVFSFLFIWDLGILAAMKEPCVYTMFAFCKKKKQQKIKSWKFISFYPRVLIQCNAPNWENQNGFHWWLKKYCSNISIFYNVTYFQHSFIVIYWADRFLTFT